MAALGLLLCVPQVWSRVGAALCSFRSDSSSL
jgi:hypothetical protein